MLMTCPHCKGRLKIRTSREVSLLTREAYLQCEYVHCAYTCAAIISQVRTIAPSMKPNPQAYLPVSRKRPTAQDTRQMDLLGGK